MAECNKNNEQRPIDVRKIYPNSDNEWADYQPMLEAFGTIIVQIDDDDYQGDTRVLYDNDGKIGHLVFGWGSCSGCDALQACTTYDELQELCDQLQESIIWFEDKKTALEWFVSHDWKGDYSWHSRETREYVNFVMEYLIGDAKKKEK